MQTFLTVLFWIAAFCILFACLPIHIRCTADTAHGADVSVRVRVLGISIRVFPLQKKRPDLRRFRIKALRKRGKQLEAKEKKKKLAARRRAEKKKKKQAAAEKKAAAKAAKTGIPPKKRSIVHLVKLILALVKVLLAKFGRYLRIDIRALTITAAAKNPADAAVLYGTIYALLESFWAAVSNTAPFSRVKKNHISICVDYLAETPYVFADLTFTLRVWHLFALLTAAGAEALRVRRERLQKESAEEKAARQRREAEARAAVLRDLK